jgi:pyridoxal phosphate enzyme (YggS family)
VSATPIADRVAEVQAAVRAAAVRAGRSPDEVCIVAASKTWPAAALRAVYAAGIRDFGENYAGEMLDKMAALADLPDITWHFIGRVQRGNAKAIARADVVHGVGSRGQAEALAKARRAVGGAPLPVLLQVNVADEDSKNGFVVGDLAAAAHEIAAIPELSIRGLMAMPDVDTDALPAAFARLRRLRDEVGSAWPMLSMGMSGDFEIAIAAGATHVRIGTRLFGARPNTPSPEEPT